MPLLGKTDGKAQKTKQTGRPANCQYYLTAFGRKARREHLANVSFLLSSCLPKKQTK
jgi:hypothetical protein